MIDGNTQRYIVLQFRTGFVFHELMDALEVSQLLGKHKRSVTTLHRRYKILEYKLGVLLVTFTLETASTLALCASRHRIAAGSLLTTAHMSGVMPV
jgi:hypothetical protein